MALNVQDSGKIEVALEKNIVKDKKIEAEFVVAKKDRTTLTTKSMYHEQRLSQSKWAFWLCFWGSIAGFGIIVVCLFFSIWNDSIAWIGTIAGAVVEVVSALFYHLSNKMNEKITEFFNNLSADDNAEKAIMLFHAISDDTIRDNLAVKLSLHLAGIDEDKICNKTIEVCSKKTE